MSEPEDHAPSDPPPPDDPLGLRCELQRHRRDAPSSPVNPANDHLPRLRRTVGKLIDLLDL